MPSGKFTPETHIMLEANTVFRVRSGDEIPRQKRLLTSWSFLAERT